MVKRATLADVARRAGVSKTAVSLILNERPGSRLSADAVARVQEAASELNYRPSHAARSLRIGKTRTVGFISDEVTVTRYASAMIKGALDAADQSQHTVLIAETAGSPERTANAIDAMADGRTDGMIFASMRAHEIDLPKVPPELPVVLLNVTSANRHASVLPAERDAGYQITRLLLNHGHRRIALIGRIPSAINKPRLSATIGSRFAGIYQALAEAGIELVAQIDEDQWEPQRGYLATQELLRTGAELTALICLNDRLAFGAYQVFAEQGIRIPNDISIASFDDDVIASYLRPALTTAQIPYEQMGRKAMTMVLSGDTAGEQRLVPMPLQLRASIRKAGQTGTLS